MKKRFMTGQEITVWVEFVHVRSIHFHGTQTVFTIDHYKQTTMSIELVRNKNCNLTLRSELRMLLQGWHIAEHSFSVRMNRNFDVSDFQITTKFARLKHTRSAVKEPFSTA
jgi:hypothetical protein